MKTVRNLLFALSFLLCNTSTIFGQGAYAGDVPNLNVIAFLVAQTLVQVLFPSLSLMDQVQVLLQYSTPEIFQSVAGGQHTLQPLVDTPNMAQDINDPVEVLQVTLTRVQSQIDTGQLVLEPTYPDADVEALQQELNSEVPSILESGIATYPEHEQAGVKQLMIQKIDDFMTFLRSKITTD